MNDNIKRKNWNELKKGDTIYIITYHQATVQIQKYYVAEIREYGLNTRVTYGINEHFSSFTACSYYSRCKQSDAFYLWIATTTLEEAKKICNELVKQRIKDINGEIKTLNNKLQKWESFKKNIDNGVYIIK